MNRDNTKREYLSLKLYQYMCDQVVGSENIVKYRRLHFKVHDAIHSSKTFSHISSGSRAEGLDLPGSDMDIMFCIERFPVIDVTNTDMRYNKVHFIMKSDNAQPGFVHLVVPPYFRRIINNEVAYDTAEGCLISSREFKRILCNVNNIRKGRFKNSKSCVIHGPCLSSQDESEDYALCFRCETWPHVARCWLSRKRLHNWPNTELLKKIASHGVLLVPIGSKSTEEDNPLEWRISFSEPEKLLIYSFNHTQLLCYALLKLVLKQIINKDDGTKNLLCSYFLKTAMFWISEELEISTWRPSNLLPCFWNCIQRVLYWIRLDYLPNYFIPEHNMISGKFNEQNRIKLVLLIERLQLIGWKSLKSCELLAKFMESDITETRRSLYTRFLEFEKAVIPLLFQRMANITDCQEPFDQLVESRSIKCLKLMFSDNNLSKRHKKLCAFHFALSNMTLAVIYANITHRNMIFVSRVPNNKTVYKHIKKCLPHLLIGTNIDALHEWVMLAILFYSTNQYMKSIQVLNHASNKLSKAKLSVTKPANIKDIKEIRYLKDLSFCQLLRTEIVSSEVSLGRSYGPYSLFHPEDLTVHMSEGGKVLTGSPSVLTYFLRFLCYRHLNHHDKCVQDQKCLKRAIEDGHLDDDEGLLGISYVFLMKASEQVNDFETASDCICKFESLPVALLKSEELSNFFSA